MGIVASEALALTEQHRLAQLQVRARALHDFMLLWPIWKAEDPASFKTLVAATIPLVQTYRRLSAAVAGSYYDAFRNIENVSGSAAPLLAGDLPVEQIIASMFAVADVRNRDALAAGMQAQKARQSGLAGASGAITRHVLNAGRDTILQTVQNDKQAEGWARVTDGDPCAFCLTFASRGAVYKSEQTASFEAHDHCGCAAMAVFKGTAIPNLDRWRSVYDAAQQAALDDGTLQHGENSSKARLNAVRRHLAAQHDH